MLRANIEAISNMGKSLMAEGLETRVSFPVTADLIASLLRVQR